MFEHIEKIAARLTDNDCRQLSDIYEPTEVAIPDQDPFRSLCVTDDDCTHASYIARIDYTMQ